MSSNSNSQTGLWHIFWKDGTQSFWSVAQYSAAFMTTLKNVVRVDYIAAA